MAHEIAAAQESLADITGQAPRFFRAPAGLRNPFLAPVLERLDLQLVSWTRRGFDTVRSDPVAMLARLGRGLAAGDILLLHDGHAARTRDGAPIVVSVLPALLERIAAAGLSTVTLPAALRVEPLGAMARA
jgi:peptidoglycan/xylan/chitin deacetylase (PgdA/CDA1 family)